MVFGKWRRVHFVDDMHCIRSCGQNRINQMHYSMLKILIKFYLTFYYFLFSKKFQNFGNISAEILQHFLGGVPPKKLKRKINFEKRKK